MSRRSIAGAPKRACIARSMAGSNVLNAKKINQMHVDLITLIVATGLLLAIGVILTSRSV